MHAENTPALPPLRPQGRGAAYNDELRAIDAAHGATLEAEARALKGGGGLTIRQLCGLALRYRLRLAALAALLEDRDVLKAGVYERMKGGTIAAYADGTSGGFAPLRLLAEHIAEYGLPEPAPGVEEG